MSFYALKLISYILLFKNQSAEKAFAYEQFGVVKEQPILGGSQQFWKLTYPKEVLSKEGEKKECHRFYHDCKRYNEILIYIQCTTEETVSFKKIRQNTYRNQPPNHHLLNALCFPFLATICYWQKATVFIYFPLILFLKVKYFQ